MNDRKLHPLRLLQLVVVFGLLFFLFYTATAALTIPLRPSSFPLKRPTAKGTVVVWGSGPTNVPAGLTGVVQVAGCTSNNVALALKSDGTVVAWGNGQATNIPVALTDVVQVAGGASHAVALKSDGTVVSWGYAPSTTVPEGLSGVVQVACGGYRSIALKSDGTVVTWGGGHGETNAPPGLADVVQVAGGYYDHAIALKSNGTVTAWGTDTNVPAGLDSVVQVSGGYDNTTALKSDGTLTAWGKFWFGQTNVPAGLSGVVQVASGVYGSIALKSDGTVVAWGYGQTNVPAGLGGVLQVAAGNGFSMALRGFPEISVEQPVGTNLPSNSGAISIGNNLVNVSSAPRTYTLRNTGANDLTDIAINKSGTNAGDFAVEALPPSTLAAGGSMVFTVTLTPLAGGNRTAQLSIASNAPDQNPFIINLSGFGIGQTLDSDGDGLNDAAEYKMSALGFDWQVPQPALVSALTSNINDAGYYSLSQIQALSIDPPLLTQNANTGLFKLTIAVKKSTNLQMWGSFPLDAQKTFINAQGEIEYEFTVPDKAAFFRLESR